MAKSKPATKKDNPEVISEAEVKSAVMSDSTPPVQVNNTNDVLAITSLIFGLLNLCAWILPCCGFFVSIITIITAVMGIKSAKFKTVAIIGLVLGVIGLGLAMLNSFLGVLSSY